MCYGAHTHTHTHTYVLNDIKSHPGGTEVPKSCKHRSWWSICSPGLRTQADHLAFHLEAWGVPWLHAGSRIQRRRNTPTTPKTQGVSRAAPLLKVKGDMSVLPGPLRQHLQDMVLVRTRIQERRQRKLWFIPWRKFPHFEPYTCKWDFKCVYVLFSEEHTLVPHIREV